MKELFYTEDDLSTELLVVVGNHDVGFHYDMNSRKLDRFHSSFNSSFVKLYQPRKRNDLNFVMVNSMSLENDGCRFCERTNKELRELNQTLKCLKLKSQSKLGPKCQDLLNRTSLHKSEYSRPILFTHFPLYRQSDLLCPEDIDTELYVNEKLTFFKENFDCLSKESTKKAFFNTFSLTLFKKMKLKGYVV